MDVQSMKRKYWMSLFEEKANLKDISVRRFCEMKGVGEKSYWYFHKALADEMEEKPYPVQSASSDLPTFLEVSDSELFTHDKKAGIQSSYAVIHSGNGIFVSISEDISDTFLLRLSFMIISATFLKSFRNTKTIKNVRIIFYHGQISFRINCTNQKAEHKQSKVQIIVRLRTPYSCPLCCLAFP
ncbi:MAG: hypothetical protein IJK53_10365 [Erysipelotrichaceae bacterium]|nr:hypothetical protein [Erysipelotrichaceae bacterium]